MWKTAVVIGSALVMVSALTAAPQGRSPRPSPKVEPKAKGKKKAADGVDDLKKAYDLLRRLRSDEGPAGRPGERLRDWTNRASSFYRKGIEANRIGDYELTHEYGAAAHDLARAVNHARNAERFDRPDPDPPAPTVAVGEEREQSESAAH